MIGRINSEHEQICICWASVHARTALGGQPTFSDTSILRIISFSHHQASRTWRLNCGHACTFGRVDEAVSGGKPPELNWIEFNTFKRRRLQIDQRRHTTNELNKLINVHNNFPAGKGVVGLLSWHGSHFWVCITFCKVHHGDSVTKPDYYYYQAVVYP